MHTPESTSRFLIGTASVRTFSRLVTTSRFKTRSEKQNPTQTQSALGVTGHWTLDTVYSVHRHAASIKF